MIRCLFTRNFHINNNDSYDYEIGVFTSRLEKTVGIKSSDISDAFVTDDYKQNNSEINSQNEICFYILKL